MQLNNTVMRDESSHLDSGLKRRISAICSFLNKSAYCVAHNTNTLMNEDSGDEEGWGFSAQDVAKLLDPAYAPNDPAEKAAIEYAKAASSNHSNVPRSVLESPAGHMTPPQIVELACVVGFWAMYNRFTKPQMFRSRKPPGQCALRRMTKKNCQCRFPGRNCWTRTDG